ncbi:MAG: MATE family efflux transporter, partial [Chitinophagaceae bacterium]
MNFWSKLIKTEAHKTLRLAFPIVMGEIIQMSLHLIDMAMIGSISYQQLAASALAFNVIHIPFVCGIGMTMSVSQMVSLANGKKDKQLVSHYLFNGFWLCVVTAIIITVGLEFGKEILWHLKQDPEVVQYALPFFSIVNISIIPMLLFMGLKQFTDGLEFPMMAMLLSLIALPLNAFLNWMLIFGNLGMPRLELLGAAYGTLFTRIIIFIVLAIIIFRHKIFRRYIAVRKNQWKLYKKTIGNLLNIGATSSLQMGMEAGAFAVSGIIIGMIGAIELSAHQIALSCASFSFLIAYGFAQATSIRISNAYATKNFRKINTIWQSSFMIAMGYVVFTIIAYFLLKNHIPYIFNDNKEVTVLASTLLLYAAIFQLFDTTQVLGSGALRGVKQVRTPTVFIAIAYWVLGLPLGWYLAFYTKLEAQGIWIGLIIGLTFASVTLNTSF